MNFVEGEALGTAGRLGMTILPGVKDPGRWDRDLAADLSRITGHRRPVDCRSVTSAGIRSR